MILYFYSIVKLLRTFVCIACLSIIIDTWELKNCCENRKSSQMWDTYWISDSKRSVTFRWRPLAICSTVSKVGDTCPLTILFIVDLDTPVMIDTWRTERFLSYMICPSNTFIVSIIYYVTWYVFWEILVYSPMAFIYKLTYTYFILFLRSTIWKKELYQVSLCCWFFQP